jgi:hypothetical protein
LIKDVGLTALGMTLIASQAFMTHPKYEILAAGVVLTGGVATFRIGKVMSARVEGTSPLPASTESPAPSESPSSPPELEVTSDEP